MTDKKSDEPVILLNQVTEAITALKSENDRREALNKESAALEARRLLGGGSSAGQQPEVKREESPKEYVKRVMEGRI